MEYIYYLFTVPARDLTLLDSLAIGMLAGAVFAAVAWVLSIRRKGM